MKTKKRSLFRHPMDTSTTKLEVVGGSLLRFARR